MSRCRPQLLTTRCDKSCICVLSSALQLLLPPSLRSDWIAAMIDSPRHESATRHSVSQAAPRLSDRPTARPPPRPTDRPQVARNNWPLFPPPGGINDMNGQNVIPAGLGSGQGEREREREGGWRKGALYSAQYGDFLLFFGTAGTRRMKCGGGYQS